MKTNYLKMIFALLVVAFLTASCKKENSVSEMQVQDSTSPLSYSVSELPANNAKDGDESSRMTIGKDKGIPFSLKLWILN